MMEENEKDCVVYLIVNNIPANFHSYNLRSHFSQFLENGRFHCFHFRHRPEVKVSKTLSDTKVTKTCCCVIAIKSVWTNQFLQDYNKCFWTDEDGKQLHARCFISKIRLHR